MDWIFSWSSYVFDEISLVYEKAEANSQLQKQLHALEEQALAEIHQNGNLLPPLKEFSKQKLKALSMEEKEQIAAGLAGLGLMSLQTNLKDPIISVRFAPMFPAVMGCTIFSVLNRLEKLDGSVNLLFPKMTLELYVPLGGKKGLLQWELLIAQLYPWLTVSERASNYIAAAEPVKAEPSEP